MFAFKMSKGRNNGPKDTHTLILVTYEQLTMNGQRDFVNMIKAKDLEIRTLSWIFWVDSV